MNAEPAHARLTGQLLAELRALVSERVSTAEAVRHHHGHGEGYTKSMPPDAVVFPRTTEEISAIVKACAQYDTPIIPFGTGTSLEGHVMAIHGGVCIDMTQMNQIVGLSSEDLDCRVEAGVTRKQLNDHIRDQGLFFPIDPGADASLGGMAATRASGTNAVRYGTMKENVLGLTVVLANGDIIKTGGRARKSAAGYDLTSLFIGSEGTLGIITEIQLRLRGIPEAMSAAICQFSNLKNAVDTVIMTIQSGVPVARIELLDDKQMTACVNFSKLSGFENKPTLLFEFHGTLSSVAEQAETVGAFCGDNNGSAFRWASRPEDRSKLWQARHDAYYAALALAPGKMGLTTDTCVPISRLADCIMETQKDIEASGLLAPIVGHVGDGNFHLVILVDPENIEEMNRAEALNHRLVHRAIMMGGTCTGEHGIGYGKREFLASEHGTGIATMKAIKQALDPRGILNPGKIF
jgi:D-lactate dehydrogenase (cytochrome)